MIKKQIGRNEEKQPHTLESMELFWRIVVFLLGGIHKIYKNNLLDIP